MSTQTQDFKQDLQAFNDRLNAAVSKDGEQAKADIKAALVRADEAKIKLQAFIKADNAQTKADAAASMNKLQEAVNHAKAAVDANGAQIQTHLKQSIASAKAALEG